MRTRPKVTALSAVCLDSGTHTLRLNPCVLKRTLELLKVFDATKLPLRSKVIDAQLETLSNPDATKLIFFTALTPTHHQAEQNILSI